MLCGILHYTANFSSPEHLASNKVFTFEPPSVMAKTSVHTWFKTKWSPGTSLMLPSHTGQCEAQLNNVAATFVDLVFTRRGNSSEALPSTCGAVTVLSPQSSGWSPSPAQQLPAFCAEPATHPCPDCSTTPRRTHRFSELLSSNWSIDRTTEPVTRRTLSVS